MVERGTVIEVFGDVAKVLFKRSSACKNCKACGMLKDMSEVTVEVKNVKDAKPGDQVAVEYSSRHILLSGVVAYVFPLVMLFIGVFLGHAIISRFFEAAQKDVVAAVTGLILTAISYGVIRLCNPLIEKRLGNRFVMISVLNNVKEDDTNGRIDTSDEE